MGVTAWLLHDTCKPPAGCIMWLKKTLSRWHYGYKPTIYYPKPSKSDLYDVGFPTDDCVDIDNRDFRLN